MSNINPFDKCPVYETNNLIFTKVKEEDAIDLFECYSDPITKKRINNDNCSGEWDTPKIDAVIKGIQAWRQEFDDRSFIRWSINHKQANKIVGTIEIAPVPNTTRFWDGACQTGILRIDIISSLENEMVLSEILRMVSDNFYADFDIKNIIIKATKDDGERVLALENNSFGKLEDNTFPYSDYYIKRK
jgi:RimJ/RimL family protein N-acetyltransferase